MSFNDVIMFIMALGILAGAIDKIIGNKLGLGKEFDEGFKNMGTIGLSIIGIISFAPVIADFLSPFIVPFFKRYGIDPAMFGTILANDLGGYSLAVGLAEDSAIGLLAGTTISSMIGCTIVFAIPVGVGLVQEKDYKYFFKGVMLGIIAMPFGSIIAGLFYGIGFKKLLINCIPLLIIAAVMVIGIMFFQTFMIKVFELFGKLMAILATVGLAAASFKYLTGITLIKGLAPLKEGADVLIDIAIVLMGSYPIIKIFKWILAKPLDIISKKFGMNAESMMGLIVALANSVPVFSMIKDMNPKGKVINSAWVVCAAASLGAHLGFTAGVAPSMIATLLIGKISAGLIAVLFAALTKAEKIK
ncbi:MAG: ethanolamine utilization protein EutH [Lachnospiraceae bacterium]|nr:ethanolamine utilization protein EutH [Lachnospiraceae bacterium]